LRHKQRRTGSAIIFLQNLPDPNLSRSELAQNFLAGRRERGCLCRQALHDPSAAGFDASAKRANIAATRRPQDENLLAGPQRPQHQLP
jgi:hypothetical protein